MILAVTLPVDQFLPTFIQGATKIRESLLPVAVLICMAGMMCRVIPLDGYRSGIVTIARLTIVWIIISFLPTIGNDIQLMVDDVMKQSGFSMNTNVLDDYQRALNTKFATQGQTQNPWDFLFHGADQIGIVLIDSSVYFLSLVAMICMWGSTIGQVILYNIQLALSPLLLACIMVPALIGLATRFCTVFVSICMWGIGWVVCDLGTKILIDMAVNSSNSGVGALNASTMVSGFHASILWWLAIVIWVIATSFLAPVIISAAIITGGHHGMGLMLGAIAGSSLSGMRTTQTAARTMTTTSMALSTVAGNAGRNVAGLTGARGVAPVRNFATRS